MSTFESLPGNPHAARADWVELEGEPYAAVEATLALAYEQRTANLIALYSSGTVQHGEATYGLLPDRANQILEQINERMGF